MTRLLLSSLLVLVLALFSPLLFLPRVDGVQQEMPEETALPAPEQGKTDAQTVFTVLGADGVYETNMADYLAGSVAAEMPALFHREALRAQAVAIRTYVLHNRTVRTPNHPQADICIRPDCCEAWLSETELRERWGSSYEENMRKIAEAVYSTDGQYLSYEGQAIQAVFHASSAGKTENSGGVWTQVPYLVSVSSPETDDTVERLTTTVTLPPEDLGQRIRTVRPEADTDSPPESWLGAVARTDSGRVASVELCGVTLTGTEARRSLGLRSTDFDVSFDGENFVFTVRGYGHGVGMSQQGADLLAENGMDYAEILEHYYPGTELISP